MYNTQTLQRLKNSSDIGIFASLGVYTRNHHSWIAFAYHSSRSSFQGQKTRYSSPKSRRAARPRAEHRSRSTARRGEAGEGGQPAFLPALALPPGEELRARPGPPLQDRSRRPPSTGLGAAGRGPAGPRARQAAAPGPVPAARGGRGAPPSSGAAAARARGEGGERRRPCPGAEASGPVSHMAAAA